MGGTEVIALARRKDGGSSVSLDVVSFCELLVETKLTNKQISKLNNNDDEILTV